MRVIHWNDDATCSAARPHEEIIHPGKRAPLARAGTLKLVIEIQDSACTRGASGFLPLSTERARQGNPS